MNRRMRALIALCALFILSALGGYLLLRGYDKAKQVYIYGYPLVTMDSVRGQQTNVAVADEQHAPMGQMIKKRAKSRDNLGLTLIFTSGLSCGAASSRHGSLKEQVPHVSYRLPLFADVARQWFYRESPHRRVHGAP